MEGWVIVGAEGAEEGGAGDEGRFIATGCIVCGRLELPPGLPAGIETFSCGHRAFRAALDEHDHYEAKSFRYWAGSFLDGGRGPGGRAEPPAPLAGAGCPLCPLLEGAGAPYAPAELLPYYRLPAWGGTIIVVVPTVDPMVLETPHLFTADPPRLLDFEGYRGTGLRVIHPKGISSPLAQEYFPVWDLYEDYVTPSLLSEWGERMKREWGQDWCDVCDGFRPQPGVLLGVDLSVISIEEGVDAALRASIEEGELTIDYGDGSKVLRISEGEAHFGDHLLATWDWAEP
jgi:hypothetical protein